MTEDELYKLSKSLSETIAVDINAFILHLSKDPTYTMEDVAIVIMETLTKLNTAMVMAFFKDEEVILGHFNFIKFQCEALYKIVKEKQAKG